MKKADITEDAVILETPDDLVKLMTAKKQPLLLYALKHDMSFKEFRHGYMHVALSEKSDKDLIGNLRKFLEAQTHLSWVVDIDYEPLGETLADLEFKGDKKNIYEYPLVKLEISSTSHPFFTGKMKLVDTAGRVDKFRNKYARHFDAGKTK